MEYIPQSQAEKYEGGGITSWEYATASTELNVALIQIDGRYPESGYTANSEVDSLIQIVEGEGSVTMKSDGFVNLKEGDQIHIAQNEAYFFKGKLKLVYAATPAWTPEQTRQIE